MHTPNTVLLLISTLTAQLAVATASTTPITSTQAGQLVAWAAEAYPKLTADLSAVRGGNFMAFFKFIEDVRTELQSLKGILGGLDRAQVGTALLRFVVEQELPAEVQAWATPLVAPGVLENLLEGSYLTAFGPGAVAELPTEVHTETPPDATGAAITSS